MYLQKVDLVTILAEIHLFTVQLIAFLLVLFGKCHILYSNYILYIYIP